MKHCVCHTECVSLCGLFSSLKHYFTLFEVSFILPTYQLQNWLGLSYKHPRHSVGSTQTSEASSFSPEPLKTRNVLTLLPFPSSPKGIQEETKCKQTRHLKGDIWFKLSHPLFTWKWKPGVCLDLPPVGLGTFIPQVLIGELAECPQLLKVTVEIKNAKKYTK